MNSPVKSFVQSDNRVSIICPNCGLSKLISLKQIPDSNHLLRIRCKCGHSFRVQLESRKSYRKETRLEGIFKYGGTRTSHLVIVVNVSLAGVCFELQGRHALSIGDKGTLRFTLDDQKKTVLEKELTVRAISANQISCEFIEDTAYQKELGFYLLP